MKIGITMDKKRYNKLKIKVDLVTDGLGLPIDKGIKELVIMLNYHNIGTTQSCWGHKNWGLPYPWVDIHKDYLGEIYNLINNLEISAEEISDIIRIYPTCESLLKGRYQFKKLLKKLLIE
jgi:hypothetical protein